MKVVSRNVTKYYDMYAVKNRLITQYTFPWPTNEKGNAQNPAFKMSI